MDHLQVLRQNYTPFNRSPLNRSHQLHRTMMKLSLLHGPTLLSIPHYLILKRREKRELCRHQEEFLLALQLTNILWLLSINQFLQSATRLNRESYKNILRAVVMMQMKRPPFHPLLKGHIRIPQCLNCSKKSPLVSEIGRLGPAIIMHASI